MRIRMLLLFLHKKLQKVNTKQSRFHMSGKKIDVKGEEIIGKIVGMAYSIQQLCGNYLNLCHLDISTAGRKWKKLKFQHSSLQKHHG